MFRIFSLALITLAFWGCATSSPTTADAPLETSSKMSVDLKVESEPTGAQVELLEFNLANSQESSLRKTGQQGTTPCQFTLEQNQSMRYVLEFKKDQFKTLQYNVSLQVDQGTGPEKTAKVIDAMGNVLISPALWLLAAGVRRIPGGKSLTAEPNPVSVTLLPESPPAATAKSKPQLPGTQTAAAVEWKALLASLALSPTRDFPGADRPVLAKVHPFGRYARLEGFPQEFTSLTLRQELEKGGKLVFARGVLEVGDKTYHFQEGASIVSLGQGKFLGWGINGESLKEARAPGKTQEETEQRQTALEPEDDD